MLKKSETLDTEPPTDLYGAQGPALPQGDFRAAGSQSNATIHFPLFKHNSTADRQTGLHAVVNLNRCSSIETTSYMCTCACERLFTKQKYLHGKNGVFCRFLSSSPLCFPLRTPPPIPERPKVLTERKTQGNRLPQSKREALLGMKRPCNLHQQRSHWSDVLQERTHFAMLHARKTMVVSGDGLRTVQKVLNIDQLLLDERLFSWR